MGLPHARASLLGACFPELQFVDVPCRLTILRVARALARLQLELSAEASGPGSESSWLPGLLEADADDVLADVEALWSTDGQDPSALPRRCGLLHLPRLRDNCWSTEGR